MPSARWQCIEVRDWLILNVLTHCLGCYGIVESGRFVCQKCENDASFEYTTVRNNKKIMYSIVEYECIVEYCRVL